MEDIFSTRQRIKILEEVIFKTSSISVNNIAATLKLSKGLVSKYFDILSKEGVLKRTKDKFYVNDSSLVKAIKILLNVKKINTTIFKKYPFVESVGLYGSCAKGENTEDSDIDLWIKVKNTEEERLASLNSELNRKIKDIKVLFLNRKKTEKLKEEDVLFYHSLVFGSIIIYGNKDGIQI